MDHGDALFKLDEVDLFHQSLRFPGRVDWGIDEPFVWNRQLGDILLTNMKVDLRRFFFDLQTFGIHVRFLLRSNANFFFRTASCLFLGLATGLFLFQARFSFNTAASFNLDAVELFFLCLLQYCNFCLDSLFSLGSLAGRLLGLLSNPL